MTTLTLIEAKATDASSQNFMCKAHHSELNQEIDYYVRVDEADYHLTKQLLDQIFDVGDAENPDYTLLPMRQDIVFHPYVAPTEAEMQAELELQATLDRIAELTKMLTDSDFKFYGDYDQKDTPEWLQLKADRQLWRDEIRALELLVV